jgi:UDP-2,3-diacylglucosamine hydrolase
VSAEPLAIIAGSGSIPPQVAAAAREAGRQVFVAALSGSAKADDFVLFDCETFGLGQFGALKSAFDKRGITDVVFIGGLVRPGIGDIKPDFGAIRHIGAVIEAFRKGDDGLLTSILGIFETQGFRIVDALAVAPELSADRAGPLGRVKATDASRAEIAEALALIKALSPFDVGQAVVVADGRAVAVEGAEGTDGLLTRVGEMRRSGRLPRNSGGVLIKAPKDGQDLRVDLPTIGPATIRGAAEAGLRGIGVVARKVMIADKAGTVALADELGLFIEAQA